ncbi:hypothetical protein LWM68_30180 [Niabella sp. W65]|nr:hypothetical protein [Niabella sp. W65]MCH7366656.1 hypothetical protein [Niabella sp. W65]
MKGYANLGYILKDKKIIDEARTWLDAVLKSQRADGYFGPMILKMASPTCGEYDHALVSSIVL